MNNKLLCIGILLVSSLCLSQQLSVEEQRVQKKWEDAKKKADAAQALAQTELDKYKDAVAKYGTRIADWTGSTVTDVTTGTSTIWTRAKNGLAKWVAPDDPIIQSRVDAATLRVQQKNADEANKADEAARAAKVKTQGVIGAAWGHSVEALKADVRSAGSTLSAAGSSTYLAGKDKAMLTWMATIGGLQADMERLNSSYGDLRDAKLFMERQLDRSVLAFYMQDKMERMLNSNTLCQAASACKAGNNGAVVKPGSLNSIFPIRPVKGAAPARGEPSSPEEASRQ